MHKFFITPFQLTLLLLAAGYNFTVYSAGRILASDKSHLSFMCVIDEKIPLLPWMTVIYLGCYFFWIAGYILAVKGEKEERDRFFLAHFMGETVSFLCFVFLPTTLTRPKLMNSSIFEKMLNFVYSIDAADNLFPSLHCFISWLCWIGVRRKKTMPAWIRIFFCVFAIAVCISTVTVKQHVVADVAGGILLAEACDWMGGRMVKLSSFMKNTSTGV